MKGKPGASAHLPRPSSTQFHTGSRTTLPPINPSVTAVASPERTGIHTLSSGGGDQRSTAVATPAPTSAAHGLSPPRPTPAAPARKHANRHARLPASVLPCPPRPNRLPTNSAAGSPQQRKRTAVPPISRPKRRSDTTAPTANQVDPSVRRFSESRNTVGSSRQSSRLSQGHQPRAASTTSDPASIAPANARASHKETRQPSAGMIVIDRWMSLRTMLVRTSLEASPPLSASARRSTTPRTPQNRDHRELHACMGYTRLSTIYPTTLSRSSSSGSRSTLVCTTASSPGPKPSTAVPA